jgi:hypothetical protein
MNGGVDFRETFNSVSDAYSLSAGIWRGARVAAYSFSLVTSSKDPVAKIKLVVQYETNQEAET